MRPIVYLLSCIACLLPFTMQASEWYFIIRPAYFYPTDSVIKKIFNSGGAAVQGEIDFQFSGPVILWLNGAYFAQSGKAIGGPELVDMQLASGTLGLKFAFYLNKSFAFYAGAGARLFHVRFHNYSPYVKAVNHKTAVGPAYAMGVWIFPRKSKHLFIDLFADYATRTMHFSPNGISSYTYSTKVNGVTFGLGLGYRL